MVKLVFIDSLAYCYVVSNVMSPANYKLAERLEKDPGTETPVAMAILVGVASWFWFLSTSLAARWLCSEKHSCSLCISMLMVSCHLFPAGAWGCSVKGWDK